MGWHAGAPVSFPPSARGGFTLLELLLSIMILSLVFLVIMGALRLGFRSVESGEKKVEALERIRNAVNLIEAQIESEVLLSYEENGEKKYYFRGGRTALDFATNYSIWGGEKGFVVAGYRADPQADGRWSLLARENIIGQENRRETRMLENLEEIRFEYFVRDTSQDPRDNPGNWVEEWAEGEDLATSEKLEKVRFFFRLNRKDWTWIIPLRGRGGAAAAVSPGGQPGVPGLAPAPVPAPATTGGTPKKP
ncbi:MAG: prepilin-type N-terminal cleavage/methylation domain-containing protein [Desulfobacterota bacterium]|nr:prepilin-type N-terminal cleavage/methylation domain-containing protein [Thermodesulfobacteriota bacterium]